MKGIGPTIKADLKRELTYQITEMLGERNEQIKNMGQEVRDNLAKLNKVEKELNELKEDNKNM